MQCIVHGESTIKRTYFYCINSPAAIEFNTEDQNKRTIQQQNLVNPNQVSQQAKIERDLLEDDFYRKHIDWLNKTKSYREAFNNLQHLNPYSFSLIKTEFAIERVSTKMKMDKPSQISICPLWCPELDSNQHILADAAT